MAQQTTQFGIEFGELACEETDPGGDRLHCQYRDAGFDGQAFELVEGLGSDDENPSRVAGRGADPFPESAGSGTALVFACQRTACRADRVRAIVLRAAGSFEAARPR
ncbi:hypothetical protein RQCS_59390 (plasmid) [Rhodococcus qingshengii]|nr:hypothetical protein RQCS_59390 [Rhodococcus qingshengii]